MNNYCKKRVYKPSLSVQQECCPYVLDCRRYDKRASRQ